MFRRNDALHKGMTVVLTLAMVLQNLAGGSVLSTAYALELLQQDSATDAPSDVAEASQQADGVEAAAAQNSAEDTALGDESSKEEAADSGNAQATDDASDAVPADAAAEPDPARADAMSTDASSTDAAQDSLDGQDGERADAFQAQDDRGGGTSRDELDR